MAETDLGTRDRSGAWRPEGLLKAAPVFVWPAQPRAFLKWLFGWPGYLYPWTAIYIAISVVTWLYLTPGMETMRTFEVGWIAFILARNTVMLFLIVGAWHVRFYVQRAQGLKYKYNGRWLARDNPAFLFRNQLLDNVFWSVVGGIPVWTAYEVITLWLMANGYIPNVDFAAHPIYCTVILLLIPLFREVHFYLIHRLIHWPPLYRTVHHLHHRNANPGPWSGLSMHPVEHVLYFSGVLIHWIVPSSPLHVIFHLQHLAFAPAQAHVGFERVLLNDDTGIATGDYFHYLHHRHFECNYGNEVVPLDEWFGTFHDGSKAAEERMNERFMRRSRKMGA